MQDSEINDIYLKLIQGMTGKERCMRTVNLYKIFKNSCILNIKKENPNLSLREIEIQVAKKMYMNDSRALEIIGKLK